MAKEIQYDYGTTGVVVYALVMDYTGKIWNGAAFEAINAANWLTYAIATTEQSTTGIYMGTFPVVAEGKYLISFRLRVGGAAATTDTKLADKIMEWAGTAQLASQWNIGTRTLTSSVVTTIAQLAGSAITLTRGDTLSVAITGLGTLANYTNLFFTVKAHYSDADTASIIQIKKNTAGAGDGLSYLNGAVPTITEGSITIDNAGNGDITVMLKAASSAALVLGEYSYDIQISRSAGIPISTLASGVFNVVADYTRAVV